VAVLGGFRTAAHTDDDRSGLRFHWVHPSRAAQERDDDRGRVQDQTPFLWSLDVHADYALQVAPGRLVLLADVTNVFNKQTVTSYDQRRN